MSFLIFVDNPLSSSVAADYRSQGRDNALVRYFMHSLGALPVFQALGCFNNDRLAFGGRGTGGVEIIHFSAVSETYIYYLSQYISSFQIYFSFQ